MSSKIKALGLALVAVFAMSAMAASAAQAESSPAVVTAEKYPAILDGTQEGKLTVFKRGSREVSCETTTYSATAAEATETLTVTPDYTECHANLELPATVTMNGCNYVFHLVADTEDNYSAVSDLVCTGGNVVEIHVYSNHEKHTAGESLCTYTIGGQSGLETIDLTNKAPVIHNEGEEGEEVTTPKDWITADIEVGGISSTKHGGGALLCGASSTTTDTLTGLATLKGTDEAGKDNGITISTP